MRTKKPIRYSTLWQWGSEVKLWQYKAPLIVVGAGTLGLLLLCVVSAIALKSPQQPLQEKVNPSTLDYRDQDNPVTPDVRKEVGHPVGKLWLPWLNIEADAPFLWGGHAWMRRSTRSDGSDFDRQGIISREENK